MAKDFVTSTRAQQLSAYGTTEGLKSSLLLNILFKLFRTSLTVLKKLIHLLHTTDAAVGLPAAPSLVNLYRGPNESDHQIELDGLYLKAQLAEERIDFV